MPALWAAVIAALVLALGAAAPALRAQEAPLVTIEEDCRAFDIAPDNRIVYAVPRLKRVKKAVIERDDIWIATPKGKGKLIVDVDKFMPIPPRTGPPPSGYTVDSLAWSPDGRRIAVNMTLRTPVTDLNAATDDKTAEDDKAGTDDKPAEDEKTSEDDKAGAHGKKPAGKKAVLLLNDKGEEIRVQGSQTRFIENATNAAWLADNSTVVYLTGQGPYQIQSVNPGRGGAKALFEGTPFEAVAWDTGRNRAYAVAKNLSVHGRKALMQLDLVHETVREIGRVDGFEGELTASPSGKKVAYFVDGDVMEILDVNDSSRPVRVPTGVGRIVWGPSEKRILLKRGPDERSGDLVWVGIYDGSFVPALHGLTYHEFQIAPDGESVAVTEPGKNILKMYPLR